MNYSVFHGIPQIWLEHDKKIRPYVRAHRIMRAMHNVTVSVAVLLFLFTYKGLVFQDWLNTNYNSQLIVWTFFFGAIGGVWKLISLPFQFGYYLIERKYELSKQTVLSWLVDDVKGTVVAFVVGYAAIMILYASVVLTPSQWWITAFVGFFVFSILLAQLAPIILIPLFFESQPMKEGPLKERLLNLCKNFGVRVKEVYHLGLGEKTEKGNAAFMGLLGTKRILIGDTLYQKYTPEEVEAVFAHELGHQVHNDLWKGIFIGALLLFVSFFIARWSTSFFSIFFNVNFTSAFRIFLFCIGLGIVRIPIGVLQSAYSRYREREADRFALEELNLGSPLADALEKLTLQNRCSFVPHRFIELLTYSHPAPWRRILMLRGAH